MSLPSLTVLDLKRGDVLLYRGSSLVAGLIRLFDGGDYSHASVYEGEGNVVEALSDGLTRNPTNESVGGSLPVDVFRYTNLKGITLGDAALPPDPINHEIDLYMSDAHRYAYEDILLLALLTATRRLPIGWAAGQQLILRNILDSAAQVVAKLIAQRREPLICSEFVYRIFDEADAGGKYKILVVGSDVSGPVSAQSLVAAPVISPAVMELASPDAAAWADLQISAQSFVQKYNVAKALNTHGETLAPLAVANFVTPRDLQFSPNLHRLGTLLV